MRTRSRFALGLVAVVAVAAAAGIGACVGDSGNTIVNSDGGGGGSNDGSGGGGTTDGTVPNTDSGNMQQTDGSMPSLDAGQDTGPTPTGTSLVGESFAANSPANSGAIAAFASGGFVAVGAYQGGPNVFVSNAYQLPTPPANKANGFVITMDATGNVTDALAVEGTSGANINAVAVDPAGNIYIAGFSFSGATITTNGNNVTLAAGTFILQLDSNLKAKWQRTFEVTIPCSRCLAYGGPAATPTLAFASVFGAPASNTVTYATNKTVTSNGGYDIFLLTLDPSSGTSQWGGQIGGTGSDEPAQIALDDQGALRVVGTFEGTTLTTGQALGATPPTGPGTNDNLLVAKLDAAHNPVYANAYGDTNGTSIGAIGLALDHTGGAVVAANFSGGIDFGMGKVGANGGAGIVFVFDETQKKTVYQQVLPGELQGVRVDTWGNLLVAGVYLNAPTVGTMLQLPDAGPSRFSAYVAKLSAKPNYAAEWAFSYLDQGDAGGVGVMDLAVAPSGTSVITGTFTGAADLGKGTVQQKSVAGLSDIFFAGRNP
jgi:hypothetical protein